MSSLLLHLQSLPAHACQAFVRIAMHLQAPTDLLLPCLNILASPQGIAQRSQRLRAWLGRHSQQLRGLCCDLPPDLHRSNSIAFAALVDGRAASLRAALPAMGEALWQHRTALASLLLTSDKLEAAAEVAEMAEDGGSPLAGCTALECLTVWDYKGTAEALASTIAPLASLTCLELASGNGSPGQLLQAAPPAPLPSVLRAVVDCRGFFFPLSDTHWDVAGLAACSGLTRLDAAFAMTAAKEEFEHSLAQLR